MEELRDTLLYAKADVRSALLNSEMFSNRQRVEELKKALAYLEEAITDIEKQLKK